MLGVRPAGAGEEDILQRGPGAAEVAQHHIAVVGEPEQARDRGLGIVALHGEAVFGIHGSHRGSDDAWQAGQFPFPDPRIRGHRRADRGLEREPANQARRRVAGDHLAAIHDRDPVAEDLGFFHVVRGQHDRRPRLAHAEDRLPQVAAGVRIEPGCRLIEERHPRLVDEGEGDAQPLLLTPGHLVDLRLRLFLQVDQAQQVGHPRGGVRHIVEIGEQFDQFG